MKNLFFLLTILSVNICVSGIALESGLKSFVLVKGGTFQSGDVVTDTSRREVRVVDLKCLIIRLRMLNTSSLLMLPATRYLYTG